MTEQAAAALKLHATTFTTTDRLSWEEVLRDVEGALEDLRRRETHRLRRKLGELNSEQRDEVDRLTRSILRRIIQESLARQRGLIQPDDLRAIRDLFPGA
jgi:glutamyl-tRNA reductase